MLGIDVGDVVVDVGEVVPVALHEEGKGLGRLAIRELDGVDALFIDAVVEVAHVDKDSRRDHAQRAQQAYQVHRMPPDERLNLAAHWIPPLKFSSHQYTNPAQPAPRVSPLRFEGCRNSKFQFGDLSEAICSDKSPNVKNEGQNVPTSP